MMSSFRFGVAFDRLLFSALNRYLLKNSNSIDTEMRSLILPLGLIQLHRCEYLSLYIGFELMAIQRLTLESSSNPWYAEDSSIINQSGDDSDVPPILD